MNYILCYDSWGLNQDTWGSYLYGSVHLWAWLAFILLAIGFCFLVKYLSKKSEKAARWIVLSWAIFGLAFEIGWRIIFLTVANDTINELYPWYPAYPCNLAAFTVPITAICNNKLMKKIFYSFAALCAVIMMIYPGEIFVQPYLTIPSMKSIIQHIFIFLIPAMEITLGTYKIRFKDLWLCFCGMLITAFNSTFITWILHLTIGFADGDYIFFRFFGLTAPGYVIIPAVAFTVMTIIYALVDRVGCKTSINNFKEYMKKSLEEN